LLLALCVRRCPLLTPLTVGGGLLLALRRGHDLPLLLLALRVGRRVLLLAGLRGHLLLALDRRRLFPLLPGRIPLLPTLGPDRGLPLLLLALRIRRLLLSAPGVRGGLPAPLRVGGTLLL